MTIALEMALPGLVGHWLDERFATGFLLTLIGVVLGCSVAFWQLLQIAKNQSRNQAEAVPGPSENNTLNGIGIGSKTSPNGGTQSRQREEDGARQE